MKPSLAASPSGFTLVEVMVSMTLCVILAMAGTTAYFKVLRLVNRAEARIAMHASAQVLYGTLHRQCCVADQHCAMVLESVAGDGTGSSSDAGSWTLIFMHGKESNEDWQWGLQSQGMNEDLVWEKWKWTAGNQTLWNATSSTQRGGNMSVSFIPSGTVDFGNSNFLYLPTPRRSLSATMPEYTLNDNILFPATTSATYPMVSLGCPNDYGDMQDLDNRLAAALTHVTACSLEVVEMNGTKLDVNDTATTTTVLQGAWMDGRYSANVTDPQYFANAVNFAKSDLAQRPRLIRFQYTVTDAATQLSQTFSFSFPMPAMSGPP